MSEQGLVEALNDCMDRLAAGETLQQCVQRYPQYADELRALLDAGLQLPNARAEAAEINAMRQRVSANVDRLIFGGYAPPTQNAFQFRWWVLAAVVVISMGAIVLILLPRPQSRVIAPEAIITETFTASPVVTQVPTLAFTPTHTPTPTRTFAPRSSDTPTPTATLTQTPTPTVTASPTPTQTATPTMPDATSTLLPAVVCEPRSDWVTYTIQAGDTVSSLAARSGSTVETILMGNCLESTTLFAGQLLRLPADPAPPASVPTLQPQQPPANNESVAPNNQSGGGSGTSSGSDDDNDDDDGGDDSSDDDDDDDGDDGEDSSSDDDDDDDD